MSKSTAKILFFVSAFCFVLTAATEAVRAQCDGVYFKRTTRKILADQVVFADDQKYLKDLTGDGRVDLIGAARDAASGAYNKIYILPSDGAGGFGAPIYINLPAAVEPVFYRGYLIVDFNGDSKNDVAVQLQTNPTTLLIYQNNGSGVFNALTPFILSFNENLQSMFDINSDGRADLFTSGYDGGHPASYYRLANADGTFGSSVQLANADYSLGGDFNGDGKTDFPVLQYENNAYILRFYYNLGNGVFALGNSSINFGNAAEIIAVRDFNNDGKPDLALRVGSNYSTFAIVTSLGNDNYSRADYSTGSTSYMALLFGDFNGDGFTDISGLSASSSYSILTNNGAGAFTTRRYTGRFEADSGFYNSIVADFDSDGKADVLSLFDFNYTNSEYFPRLLNENQLTLNKNVCARFGQTKIVDFDGDGLPDPTFWRASDGRWRYQTRPYPQVNVSYNFGQSGDVPVPGDYDADGKTDFAVYRPSSGVWYTVRSSDNSFFGIQFGAPEDKPVASDYNGDGRTDFAVFRPSSGIWYVLYGGTFGFYGVQFGASEDRPVPEDYDGDGKTDFAVFRPSNGVWYVLQSTNLSFFGVQWGAADDQLAPADYDGDGKADIAVARAGSPTYWYIRRSYNQQLLAFPFAATGDIAQVSDWSGDGFFDLGIYRPNVSSPINNNWFTNSYPYGGLAVFRAETGEVPISSLNKSY